MGVSHPTGRDLSGGTHSRREHEEDGESTGSVIRPPTVALLPTPGAPRWPSRPEPPRIRGHARTFVRKGSVMSMIEPTARYQYIYGLKACGAHRDVARELLGSMRAPCVRCGGRATGHWADGDRWACPHCEGTGGVWTRRPEEVEAAYQQVLARYPDAAVTSWSALTFAPAFPELRPRGATNAHTVTRRKRPIRHGVFVANVPAAFELAEDAMGRNRQWKLKGRGHDRRVTLDHGIARYALRGCVQSWQWVTPKGSGWRRRLWPRPVVEEAAEILGVDPEVLISREF